MEADFAPVAPPQIPPINWYVDALGFGGLVLIPAAALLAFVLCLLIVTRGRGRHAGAMLVLCALAPLIVSLLVAVEGTIHIFRTIGAPWPTHREVADGLASALVSPQLALILSVPIWCVGILGGILRTFRDDPNRTLKGDAVPGG